VADVVDVFGWAVSLAVWALAGFTKLTSTAANTTIRMFIIEALSVVTGGDNRSKA
jgi:hypothetical protein